MGARETALHALMACRQEDGWSNGVLKNLIVRDKLDGRDAALATRLCYGVLQNRLKLDFYLQQLLTGKLKALHPVVRDILHLGLYQIYEMDRIPPSAAVNASVDLAKKYCKKQRSAPGLVNGVLRSAIRTKGTLKEPKSLVEIYSHPWELISLLRDYVGKDRLEPMLKANNGAPDTVVQVNTLKTTAEKLSERLDQEGVKAEPHIWMKNCLVLSGTGSLEHLPSFQEGLFYVQDTAAKLSVLCARLPSNPDAQILDCCSSPGGKSFAAAMEMAGKGTIHSCDVYEHKIQLIRKGAQRLELPMIQVHLQDATCLREDWIGKMDAVLADVPCSGLGIIRKKPDIRYKDLQKMQELPALQLKILETQANYVKPGGVLMYSTCTLVKAENEEVVENFLSRHPEFITESLSLPENFPVNTTGMLALVPGEYDTDGFFICRMRRKTV